MSPIHRAPLAALVTTAVATLVLACAGPQKAQRAVELDVLTYDARIVAEAIDAMRVAFPWELANPTGSAATVKRIEWQLTVEGNDAQTGVAEPDALADKGSSAKAELEVTIPFSTAAEALAARASKTTLPYTLKGAFTVATASGDEQFEAEWSGDVFAPKAPVVEVQAQAARYEQTAELTFQLVLKNPNNFAIRVSELGYRVTVESVEILSGAVAQNTEIPAAAETRYDLSRWVGREDLLELAKKLSTMKSFKYAVAPTLRVGETNFATPIEGELRFMR